MANRVNSFLKTSFTQSFLLKILAVVLGFILWAVLSNIQDPIVTKTVSVAVNYLNEDVLLSDESLVFMEGPDSVAITVSTRRSRQHEVTSAMFKCTADLVDHAGGDVAKQRVHIAVTQLEENDALLDWSYPKNDPNITVVMDNYITKVFDVTLKMENELMDGLILGGSVILDPEKVTVSGPSSMFSSLSSVKAVVNMEELSGQGSGQISYQVALKLFDANDQEISPEAGLLTLSKSSVNLSANVLCLQTVRVIISGVTGTPAEGYRYVSNVITSGSSLTVSGLKSTVADLSEIYIPASAINIDGISENSIFTIDVSQYLPEQVSLISGGIVTVNVNVEQLTSQDFMIQGSSVKLEGMNTDQMIYSIRTVRMKIQVKGFKEDLDVLSSRLDELNPVANVAGYGPGVYAVPVTITELDGYIFENLNELEVYVLIEAIPEPTPDETLPEETTTEEEPTKDETGEPETDPVPETEETPEVPPETRLSEESTEAA